MKRKEHLTEDGLRKIVAIKASMNYGLSDKLLVAFPDVVPVKRPLVELSQTIDSQWLAGFTDAEGCFLINLTPSKTKVGYQVCLVFSIGQHIRDQALLILILEFLGCGTLYKHSENAVVIMVYQFQDIVIKIIPFFKKYRMHGVKGLDFADFCKAADIMK